jgi:hypothetical protein
MSAVSESNRGIDKFLPGAYCDYLVTSLPLPICLEAFSKVLKDETTFEASKFIIDPF